MIPLAPPRPHEPSGSLSRGYVPRTGGELTVDLIPFPLEGARICRAAEPPPGQRALAGPYYPRELWMLQRALRQLRGCRGITVRNEGSGVSIFRPEADFKKELAWER